MYVTVSIDMYIRLLSAGQIPAVSQWPAEILRATTGIGCKVINLLICTVARQMGYFERPLVAQRPTFTPIFQDAVTSCSQVSDHQPTRGFCLPKRGQNMA